MRGRLAAGGGCALGLEHFEGADVGGAVVTGEGEDVQLTRANAIGHRLGLQFGQAAVGKRLAYALAAEVVSDGISLAAIARGEVDFDADIAAFDGLGEGRFGHGAILSGYRQEEKQNLRKSQQKRFHMIGLVPSLGRR
jgi:hypothetical protein